MPDDTLDYASPPSPPPAAAEPPQGALPIMKGSEIIGVFAVSGAPGGDKDEVCTSAGLAKIAGKY